MWLPLDCCGLGSERVLCETVVLDERLRSPLCPCTRGDASWRQEERKDGHSGERLEPKVGVSPLRSWLNDSQSGKWGIYRRFTKDAESSGLAWEVGEGE